MERHGTRNGEQEQKRMAGLRICYCEDETAQAEWLRKKVLEWAEKNQVPVHMDLYASAEEFLFKAEGASYDLLLLDIAMKEMNGMELARKVRERDPEAVLVFVTSDPGFALEGYEVDAYRYLMKPVREDKLFEVLAYCRTRESVEGQSVLLKSEGEMCRIMRKNILYMEARGHYVELHLCGQEPLIVKVGFADILNEINAGSEALVKIHRSYAVNPGHVARIGRTDCCLIDGERLPVSKSAYQHLNEKFIQYHLEG